MTVDSSTIWLAGFAGEGAPVVVQVDRQNLPTPFDPKRPTAAEVPS